MISQKLLNKFLGFFVVIIVVLICFICFVILKPFNLEPLHLNLNKKIDEKEPLKPITGNNLYLSPFRIAINVFPIKEQLEIYTIESRFDFLDKKVKFEVKFKNSNKIKRVCEESKLYLTEKQADIFEFSDEKTSFSMQIKKIDKENLKVILEADLLSLGIDNIKENVFESFILPISDLSFTDNIEDKYEFKMLKSSKWWGIDHFLNIHNKEEINSQKERLEIDTDILFLEEKDILIFKDGKWKIAFLNENTLNYPIARIKNIDAKAIEIEAWDISGNNKYSFFIFSNSKTPFLTKSDQFITQIKKRTNTHISCMLDKQRLVLKEKDMLIKKDNRWKLLKRDVILDDIKNEELFYFDKIEDRNSKRFLIGYLFNSMRTNYQKIEVPITSFANQRVIRKR